MYRICYLLLFLVFIKKNIISSAFYSFQAKTGMQNILAAVDCTLPALISPSDHEEAYVNYKEYNSLNVQTVGIFKKNTSD